jgi:hypothetical protein
MRLERKSILLELGANLTTSLEIRYEANTLGSESIHTIELLGQIDGIGDERRTREISFTFRFHRYLYSIIGMKLNQVEVNRASFMQVLEPYQLGSYHSLSVKLRFYGLDLPLPRDSSRPELVLSLGGIELKREEVPAPDGEGYCWVDLGVLTFNRTGRMEVNLTIEGLASDPGNLITSHSVIVQVEAPEIPDEDENEDLLVLVIALLVIFTLLLIGVLAYLMALRKKAPDTAAHEE